jgi:hypothetical protein
MSAPPKGRGAKALDEAALSALEAMEAGADTIAVVLPRMATAQLASHVPNLPDVHPRAELAAIVARTGLDTARHVEAAALAAAEDNAATTRSTVSGPLSSNKSFQVYMSLRLQLHESAEVRSAARPNLAMPVRARLAGPRRGTMPTCQKGASWQIPPCSARAGRRKHCCAHSCNAVRQRASALVLTAPPPPVRCRASADAPTFARVGWSAGGGVGHLPRCSTLCCGHRGCHKAFCERGRVFGR